MFNLMSNFSGSHQSVATPLPTDYEFRELYESYKCSQFAEFVKFVVSFLAIRFVSVE